MRRSFRLWVSKLRQRWYIYLPLGILWLLWQFFLDSVFQNIRDNLEEHSGVMNTIWLYLYDNPWTIVAVVLVALGIWAYIANKKEMRLKRKKDEYEEIDVTVIKVPSNTEYERQKRIKLGDETRKIKVPKKKNEV